MRRRGEDSNRIGIAMNSVYCMYVCPIYVLEREDRILPSVINTRPKALGEETSAGGFSDCHLEHAML
jgi:hypothetical protein